MGCQNIFGIFFYSDTNMVFLKRDSKDTLKLNVNVCSLLTAKCRRTFFLVTTQELPQTFKTKITYFADVPKFLENYLTILTIIIYLHVHG